jgi:phage N-6-adenine-methyltransferase
VQGLSRERDDEPVVDAPDAGGQAMSQATLFNRTEAEKLSGDSDELFTPQWYLDALGPIDLDPAACFGRQVARVNFTRDDDGLSRKWEGKVVHVNPPYSSPLQGRFVRHAFKQYLDGGTGVIVMLIQASTSASYWHECIWPHAQWIGFPKGRISFCGANGVPTAGGGTFSSAVVIFDEDGLFGAGEIKSRLTTAAEENGHPIAWTNCL